MSGLAAQAVRWPLCCDADRAKAALATLDPSLRNGEWERLLAGTAGSSPWLAGQIERSRDWLARNADRPPDEVLERLLDRTVGRVAGAERLEEVAKLLRWARHRAALWIALADLGGVWDLDRTVRALTRIADALVAAATDWLLADAARRGRIPGLDESTLARPGYVVLAMGKQGAHELNFSSDIDLICLFDQDRFAPDDLAEVKSGFVRLTRALVSLLSEQGTGGYVFRTDLRLRPSPSTTPVAMAMEPAERYYESVGRTWERAAHIKARPVAGDLAAGEAYLDRLRPFVWRRHLDFAAIEDIHDMLRRIRAQQGRFQPGELPGTDIKLDPGGIREIELFAQTRQLVVGGRDPTLRHPRTADALTALAAEGWVGADTAERLIADYTRHRELEHRLQMQEDAQTQTVPLNDHARRRVAHLCGEADLVRFERSVSERLARVHRLTEEMFARSGSTPAAKPPAEAAARFDGDAAAARILDRWRGGAIAATRSARARALYERLEPRILEQLEGAASPDEAIALFDRFLSGLPAGVQLFSLFSANPHLLDLIVEICAASPRLADHLGRNPRALDALLDRNFFEPLGDPDALSDDLEDWLRDEDDYERVLDLVRLWAREQSFRVGVQVLRGLADRHEAGRSFTAVADAALCALTPRVIDQFAERHGPPPGRGLAVIALGKLGSGEMTASSDLDLITVYDASGAEESGGGKPLAVPVYFPRLTKALLAALTAPTAEGRLYEVDMRLRPSGRAGPVAVSLAAFRTYQNEQAWVWEHMALTRARVVWGDPSLADEIAEIRDRAIRARRGDTRVLEEARDMRRRLVEAHARERKMRWSLKHAAGGLMETEFLIQTGLLATGAAGCHRADEGLEILAGAGWLAPDEARALAAALGLAQTLQQVERVALDGGIDADGCGQGLRRAILRATGLDSWDALQDALGERQAAAAAIIDRHLPLPEGGGG